MSRKKEVVVQLIYWNAYINEFFIFESLELPAGMLIYGTSKYKQWQFIDVL